LWDGGHYTRTKARLGLSKVEIKQPLLNMLACATPDFMNKLDAGGRMETGLRFSSSYDLLKRDDPK
jgi:hypothetical protein